MSGARVWAISDLHVSHPANAEFVAGLRPSHPDDWLIVAGDVAERADVIMSTLTSLAGRYARVIWVPGNHELWTSRRMRVVPPSTAKYDELVALCRDVGVVTPEDPYPLWTGAGGPCRIVPLFVLYDLSWRADPAMTVDQALARAAERDVVAADMHLIDPSPYRTIAGWCGARLGSTLDRLSALDPAVPTVLVNHWPLVRNPTRFLRHPDFALFCGTYQTADWHLRFHATSVVYGHLHMPVTAEYDGVRFDECSLGYPREWRARAHPRELPRQILPQLADAPVLWRTTAERHHRRAPRATAMPGETGQTPG